MDNYIPYPYPVLGNDDDFNGHFTPSMTYSINPTDVSLEIRFDLENNYIEQLIQDGRASFFIEISCSKTYYRRFIKTDKLCLSYKDSSRKLRGRVDVSFFICTNEAIEDYCPLGELCFVEAGDIIAVGGDASFVAEKEFDPLKAPIKSIVKITKLDKPQDEFTMVYKDEFITICIPEDMWDLYENAAKDAGAAEMLHASIVLPALMDAIDTLKGKGDAKDAEFANAPWALKLSELCNNRNIDMESDSLIIAQKLLGNPVKRALDWYEKKEDDE